MRLLLRDKKLSKFRFMSDDKKIIFSMVGVSKDTPAGKQIIKNIYSTS